MKRIIFSLGCMVLAIHTFSQNAPDLQNKMAGTSVMAASTARTDVSITPNPVQGTVFTIELQNLHKGKYSIFIYDQNGKKHLVKAFLFEGGSLLETYPLPKSIGKGVYILQVVSKTTTTRFSKKLIIE